MTVHSHDNNPNGVKAEAIFQIIFSGAILVYQAQYLSIKPSTEV